MVEIGFYVVDWEDLIERLPEFEQLERYEGWDAFLDAIDDAEADLPSSAAKTQADLYGPHSVYARFASAWGAPSRAPFEAFCDALFWTSAERGRRIVDVPEERADRFKMDLAWCPATVRRFAAVWGEVDLESARQPFRDHVGPGRWSFDGWASHLLAHGRMVARAAAAGHGLIEVGFW